VCWQRGWNWSHMWQITITTARSNTNKHAAWSGWWIGPIASGKAAIEAHITGVMVIMSQATESEAHVTQKSICTVKIMMHSSMTSQSTPVWPRKISLPNLTKGGLKKKNSILRNPAAFNKIALTSRINARPKNINALLKMNTSDARMISGFRSPHERITNKSI